MTKCEEIGHPPGMDTPCRVKSGFRPAASLPV
jgi:hypothetical protein